VGLYKLECENCGYIEDDVICSFDSIKERTCEKCGKKKLKNIGFCTSFELKYNPNNKTYDISYREKGADNKIHKEDDNYTEAEFNEWIIDLNR